VHLSSLDVVSFYVAERGRFHMGGEEEGLSNDEQSILLSEETKEKIIAFSKQPNKE